MKAKLINTIKYLFFLGIGVLLMYFAFRNVDLNKMFNDLAAANYGWVIFSLLFSVGALYSRAYRWGMLIEAVDKKPKTSNCFYGLSVGYFANLAFPRIGEVTRCTLLYEAEKTPITALMGTVLAERVVDIICLLSLVVLTILINVEKFSSFFMDLAKEKFGFLFNISTTKWVTLAIILIAIIVTFIVLRKKIMKVKALQKVAGFFKGIGEGFASVLKVKNKGLFIIHTVVIWIMYYVSGYICFYSMPETANLGLDAALFALVLGGIGMSAPVQGGFGAYHFLVSAGLVLYNVTTEKGLVFATIVHSSQVILMMTVGSISLIMLNILKRKQLVTTNDEARGNK